MNRRQFLMATAGLGAGTRAAIPSSKATSVQTSESAPWPTETFNHRNTNWNPEATGPNTNLERVWEQNGPGHTAAQPLITGNYLIAPSGGYIEDGYSRDRLLFENDRLPVAHIYDRDSGDLLRVVREPLHSDRGPVARMTNGMTVADGALYAVAGEFVPGQNWDRGNVVYRIDLESGDVDWWTQTTGIVEGLTAQNYDGPPIVLDDVVVVGNPSAFRRPADVLEKDTGEFIYRAEWHSEKDYGEADEGEHSTLSPAVLYGDSSLIFGDSLSYLTSWNFEEDEFDWSGSTTINGREYRTHYKNVYHRTNRHAVCADDESVYFVRALSVAAFEPKRGVWQWTRTGNHEKMGEYVDRALDMLGDVGIYPVEHGERLLAEPVLTDDSIITLSSRHRKDEVYLLCFDNGDGTIKWVREFEGTASSLAASKHSLYVGVNDQLRVLNIYTGDDLYKQEVEGSVSNIVVADGAVVAMILGPDESFEQVAVFSGETENVTRPTTTTETATTNSATSTNQSSKSPDSGTQTTAPPARTATEQSSASTPGFGVVTTLLAASAFGTYEYLTENDSED